MAAARKCDRCGKLYEPYNSRNDSTRINGIIFVNVDEERKYYGHGIKDLCPYCSTDFVNWFQNGGQVND